MCDERLIHGWLQHLQARNYAERTLDTYGGAMARFMGRYCYRHGVRLTGITPEHLDEYMASIGAQGPHRMQAALTLRSFFRWAHRRGHIHADPTTDVMPRPTPPPPPRSFSEEELIRLLVAAAWRDERRAWAILACYALGMRRSEFCSVTPEQIAGPELEVRGKGMRVRRIPLAYLQREAIEGLRPWWNGTIVGSVKPPTFTAWVNRAAKDSGIPWDRRRAHMLRAGLAKSLSERGVPVEDIRDILGHENVKTTNRYLESRAADRAEAMARLGRI